MPTRPLPPLPVIPKRPALSAPARRSISGTHVLDADTPARNPTASQFAALASVFDELTPEQRNEFVEFGFLFKRLTKRQLEELLDRALEMNGLG